MLQSFWNRITSFNPFKKGNKAKLKKDRRPTLEDIQAAMSEEFRGLRKILRKQSLLGEELRARLKGPPGAPQTEDTGEGLMRLAAVFFHLDQSLRDQTLSSPQRREAVSLFWLQLEQLLEREDIQMIRERGVPFDPRLHRAVLAREPGAPKSVVTEVLEPGFIERGQVRKSAKVIIGPEEDNQATLEAEQETEQEHTTKDIYCL